MLSRRSLCFFIALNLVSASATAFAQSKPPPQAEWDKASADITGTDKATQTAALEKIKGWVKGGWVSADVWRKWLPALVKAGRHQDVYDLATLALAGRPGPDAVVTLQEARMWGIAYNAAGVNLGASTLPWEVTDEKPTGDNRITRVKGPVTKIYV